MELTRLLRDDDAVSPVIGVILMVAITVILAAVVGTFALGLQDETEDSAPQTRMAFEYASGEAGGCTTFGTDGRVSITHEAGDEVDEGRITLGDDDGKSDGWNSCATSGVSEVSAGDQTEPEIDSDDTIRVVFTGENKGDDSAVLGKFEGPDA